MHFVCVSSFHSKTSIKSKGLVCTVNANARFRVFPDSFLKEVCFTLQANCFHPFKQICNLEVTVAPKGEKKSIGVEFDVVAHHFQVHSNQFDGRAPTINSISVSTALLTISTIRESGRRFISFEYRRHAKSQCSPSLRLISSLLKQRPGIRPRFLSQKMAQKDPKKNMPSMAANAIMHSAKLAAVESHHLSAHCVFCRMHGTVLIALRRCIFLMGSLMYVSMRREYVSLWMLLMAI